MRRLLNTFYVLSDDIYLSLDGENVVAHREGAEAGRVPLHTLESIACFSCRGASPALLGKCAEYGISFTFYDRHSRFLAGVRGLQRGNVLLRRSQYRCADDLQKGLDVSRSFIVGKVYNSRWVLERALRDHGVRIDATAVKEASAHLYTAIGNAAAAGDIGALRGIEGDAASAYFSVFNELILREKDRFVFSRRVRRPPTDPVNSMLSLFYTVLARDCAAALEGVGLDPYVGMMHADRPGRNSLALDLMEELRPLIVDRFVLTAINNQVIKPGQFARRESGEVLLDDSGRRCLFKFWQERKKEEITHPFLEEKVPWGLVPHVQALLLARYIRGDLDGYPAFLWK